ncbi:uncharacterized protein LOC134532305 [Bacillus rossius redtenbacheri]|uniref:uncharacterized protein LOC134532305 n=1 Tax=Bacillus rossius redtenbacheri TaxID=93214 RepID=UPI002FDCC7AF
MPTEGEEAEDPERTPARRCPEPPHAGTLADTAPPIDLEYGDEPRTQSHRHQRPPRHLGDHSLASPQRGPAGTPTGDLSRGLRAVTTLDIDIARTIADIAEHNQTPTPHHLGSPHSTPFADAASPGHPESEDETRTWPHRWRHPPRYLENYVLNTPPGETADTSTSCLPNDQGTEQDEPQPTVELVDEDPSPEGAPLRCHPCGDDPGTVTITELPYSPGDPEMDSDPGTIPLVTEPEEEDAENHETSETLHHAPCRRPRPSCLHSRPDGVRRATLPCAMPLPPAQLPPQSTGQRAPRHPSMRRAAAPGPAASAVDRAACAIPPFHAPCRHPRPSCLRSRPGSVRRATLPCAVPPPPAQLPPQSTGRRAPRHPSMRRAAAPGPAASAVDRAACAAPPFHVPCRPPRPSCLRSRPGGVRRATLPCAVPPPLAQLPPQSTGRRAPRHPTTERRDAAARGTERTLPFGLKHSTMRRAAAPGPAASTVDRAACAAPPFHAPCRCPRPSCLRSRPGSVRRATPPPSVATPQLGEQSGPY